MEPPFSINVLGIEDNGTQASESTSSGDRKPDLLPALYRYRDNESGKAAEKISDPTEDQAEFFKRELSLGEIERMENSLWFVGSKRPAIQLHFQLAMGRKIVVVDRMDMHLLWTHDRRLFVKPIPAFLLGWSFWKEKSDSEKVSDSSKGETKQASGQHKIALGFLYTYACLISSEADFHIAQQNRLLPDRVDGGRLKWQDWKTLARQILNEAKNKAKNKAEEMHWRFYRAELRLSRLNFAHRVCYLSPFDPHLRHWNTYGDLFRDNVSWIAAATVFVALILAAMEVGHSTDLQNDIRFQRASYGFTVFALLAPLCAFALLILFAMANLAWDAPALLKDYMNTESPEESPA